MQFDAYDTFTVHGVFPKGFVYVWDKGYNGYKQVKETIISPEEYVGDLGIDSLVKIVDKLFDDTEIHSLKTGARIGEVCLRCERIDP
jgi:hypothetical protein